MAQTSIRDAIQLAMQHQQQGRVREAELIYRKILAVRSNEPNSLHLLGLLLVGTGELAAGIGFLEKAALVDSRPAVRINLGAALQRAKRFEEAIACLQGVLVTAPDSAEAHYNLGKALADAGRVEEAIGAYQNSVRLKPSLAEGWMNLANTRRAAHRLEEAESAAKQAIALRPNSAEFRFNLGHIQKDLHLFDEAMKSYTQAATVNPNDPEPRRDASFLQLLRGEYLDGWREYEWRWKCRETPPPLWNGLLRPWKGEELRGRTILLTAEQGLGDAIQFIRYVPLLAERGAEVSVVCPAALHRLFASVAGLRHLLGPGDLINQYDFHAMLLTLPHLLGTTIDSIPANVPYLSPRAEDVERWASKLGGTGEGKKIGLVWAGNPGHTNDRLRSIPLELLNPLKRVPGMRFISLQKGAPAAMTEAWGLLDFTAELNDFTDTAALIANLELVIAVDTSVAHLAGALGKPAWILLSHVPDWRWLLHRTDSPWYPSARLFRQHARADWSQAIASVANALADL